MNTKCIHGFMRKDECARCLGMYEYIKDSEAKKDEDRHIRLQTIRHNEQPKAVGKG